jgi:oxygen-independent coproporphyrinogen-3 oxidase
VQNLVEKYNVPGPRYTSYPTVPFWKNNPLTLTDWLDTISKNSGFFQNSNMSLYIHLPYCESLCTFCGCHKRITKNHAVEGPYIDAVIKEWELYQAKFKFNPDIRELHFGGGTPTFFSPDELVRLVKAIFGKEKIDPEHAELSFEAHPNNTGTLRKIICFWF